MPTVSHTFQCTGVDPSPSYPRPVAIDAVVKLNRYKNVGSASSSIEPYTSNFFGATEKTAKALEDKGELNLKSHLREATGAEAGNLDAERGDCDTALSCARPDSKPTGPCDVHGVVGTVCAHTIPLSGMFIDMRTPEQFIFYLIIIHALVIAANHIRDVYVDFGCQLKKTWERYLAGVCVWGGQAG